MFPKMADPERSFWQQDLWAVENSVPLWRPFCLLDPGVWLGRQAWVGEAGHGWGRQGMALFPHRERQGIQQGRTEGTRAAGG